MTTANELSLNHRFIPATVPGRSPILLLHGTGGDENDLLQLGQMIAPGAALLSPRGKVLEGGMPRFFRRLQEGVFDEADVRFRAQELADFVSEARAVYGIDRPIAVGFSNGANIAAAVLQCVPDALAGAVLFRAMVPLSEPITSDLSGKPVLLISGAMDPIIPAENAARLGQSLRGAGATVTEEVLPTGHGLTQSDVVLAKAWLDRLG